MQRGVPDILFTGDGAALELRVLRAARGVQFLGPYSLFGWSHPGPAYFYLALPFYELFGERGPALNLFALAVNAAAAVALVLTAQRLLGFSAAIAAAALVSIFVSLAAPFVATNEWNPIIPMLPLALLTLMAVPLALGESTGLPTVAFLASAIVQTHVGYAAPIAALAAVVIIVRRHAERQPVSRTTPLATAAVLAMCWMLPLYEAATSRPGNLQWLIEFFAPDNLAKQTWTVAWTALREQAAVMPLGVVRAVGLGFTAPAGAQALLFFLQCALLIVVIFTSVRNGDRVIAVLAAVPLAQWAVAIVAVRAIRQPMEFYLVAWISALGLVAWIAAAAWTVRIAERRFGSTARLIVGFAAVVVIALALIAGSGRPAVFREPDPATETLAREVESFIRSNQIDRPLVRVDTRDVAGGGCCRSLLVEARDAALCRGPVAVRDGKAFRGAARSASRTTLCKPAFDRAAPGRRDRQSRSRA